MSNIYYLNSRSERVDFVEDFPLFDIDDLFGNSFTNITNNNVITGFKTEIKNYTIEGDEPVLDIDIITDIFDYDIYNNVRGQFYIGQYFMFCNIIGSDLSNVNIHRKKLKNKLTVTTDTPYWIKETRFPFGINLEIKTEGFTYPFEYPFTYGYATGTSSFTNDSIKDSNFKMIIYGPVSNPSVSINGNIYTVSTDILASEYLVIDSTSRKAYKVGISGEKTNVFSKRGLDFDIFTEIPSGRNTVQWSGAFGFDIYLYDERSKPRWISSVLKMI